MNVEIRDERFREVIDEEVSFETLGTGYAFTEGPVWHPTGKFLIFSDMPGDHMRRWSGSRGVETFRKPSNMANGNVYDGMGRLVTCEHATSRVTRTDDDGKITVLASHYEGKELNSPNDIVVKKDGRVYFTDPIYGRIEYYSIAHEPQLDFRGVFCIEADGTLRLMADDFGQPNGLCFSLDESVLFVNDTERMHIRAFDVDQDGRLSNSRLWAELVGDGPGGPDGLKVDSKGNVYCCGPGGIHVFSPDGACLGVIRTPEVSANFNWGEEGFTTLFVTASTSLYRLQVKTAGLRAFWRGWRSAWQQDRATKMRLLACAAVVWALSVLSALAAPPVFSPPHTEQLAAGVFAAGFSHRYDDATCGWAVLRDQTVMIDLPRGLDVRPFLDYVRASTGKPVKRVAITRMRDGDDALLESLAKEGVAPVPTIATESRLAIGDESTEIEFIPYGNITGFPGGAIFLPQSKVLFGGPAVVNGPHAKLTGSQTAAWSNELISLRSLDPQRVVPGSGSWGGPQILERQRRFLTELRQQVAHGVSMGQSIERITAGVRLPFSSYVWMPYDLPTPDDIKHIYRELTVPNAPFCGKPPNRLDSQPHALVLIGDRVHEPEHVEAGLRPVFEATKVVSHFTVDYHALNTKNLSHVSLLVVLRDGMLWPDGLDKPHRSWMTPDQESAVVEFVTKGGAFLSLHNSMGLFPDNGPYLKLVGGHYTGHGPPERFSVKVVDRNHPITRGVEDYFISDEQHTPVLDSSSVHILLVSGSDDGITAPAGWAYEPGKGRLVHLANGHTRDALNHPMFQRLMRNSVDWLLRRQ